MPRITKAQLERYTALKAEMVDVGRHFRAMETEAKAIEAAARADLEATAKPSINRSGYRIEWTEGRLSVSWKDELVSRMGAAVADEITKAATKPKVVRITQPAAVAK